MSMKVLATRIDHETCPEQLDLAPTVASGVRGAPTFALLKLNVELRKAEAVGRASQWLVELEGFF